MYKALLPAVAGLLCFRIGDWAFTEANRRVQALRQALSETLRRREICLLIDTGVYRLAILVIRI